MATNDPKRRVRIQWTQTALENLRALPKKYAKGLLDKADLLYEAEDPRECNKPLTGPLSGYFRICYSRYRAVYSVTEETIANGDVLVTYTITFVAAGTRRERSRDDVYELAKRAVKMGIIEPDKDPNFDSI